MTNLKDIHSEIEKYANDSNLTELNIKNIKNPNEHKFNI